ncbi:DUF6918 family protein [Corynebacterium pygosceleis]|uniref:Uncharacterized protein n=1 Tax=Corynebacterium pygosceleis TaxID=2800406 RepID=A0A9Q4C7N0_9CORY|nr:hypothetical protein [Corynebacterium pygosceleis]MCK7637223.1 hypothetical protein [Corynebacterium pygosceleis]MCK7676160.1 hypothetical protein [Corynebacterium pygosceleis]MCL0120002.1 hypothetical protein [Corynebacterium pygosceleis]MCX7445126.1 hypothetical protein [Corynebacterium pygosceleis]MCX7468449.1 hypothetical protein [Corynebacterium pygosceleis]
MTDLKTALTGANREAVVTDMAAFIDSSVSGLSGFTGMAVKGALGAARKADPDVVSKGVNRLLPEFCDALDPHWRSYRGDGAATDGGDFGGYLEKHGDEVTDSILAVADRNADNIGQPTVAKVYSSIRGKLTGIISDHLNGLGAVIEKHAA